MKIKATFTKHAIVRASYLLLSAVAALICSASVAKAQTYTWDPAANASGSGGTGTWSTTNVNWLNGGSDVAWPNANTDTATFGGTSGGTVTMSTAITAGALDFNTSGYTLYSPAGELSLGSGGIVVGSSVVGTSINMTNGANVTAGILLSTTQTWTGTDLVNFNSTPICLNGNSLTINNSVSSGTTVLPYLEMTASSGYNSNNILLGGSSNVVVNGLAGSAFYVRPIAATFNSGSESFSDTDTGTLTVNGNNYLYNTSAGGIEYFKMNTTGVLALGNNNALGGYTDVGNTSTDTNTIFQLVKGTVESSVANLALPNVTQLTGTATIGGSNNFNLSGSFTNQGGNEVLMNTNTGTTTLSGNVYLSESSTARTLTVDNNSATSMVVSGVIANDSANASVSNITFAGTGNVVLNNSDTFSGIATISKGTVTLGSAGNLTGGAYLLVNSPGTLAVSQTASGTSNAISGAAGYLDVEGGTVNMNDGVTSTLTVSGGATLNGGTLVFNISPGGLSDQLAISNGVTASGAISIDLASTGSVTNTAETYTVISSSGGGLSTGTYTIGGTVNVVIGGSVYHYSLADSTASAEIVSYAAGAATPATAYWTGSQSSSWATQTAGTELTNFSSDAAGLNNTYETPAAASNVIFTSNTATNLSTTLDGSYTINSLAFTGSSTSNTAGVTIAQGSSGTLTINASALGGNTAGSGITVAAGAGADTISAPLVLGAAQSWTNNSSSLFTVSGNVNNGGFLLTTGGTGSTTISGVISGSGGFTDSATGTVSLTNANNSYLGVTTIGSGATLAVSSLANGGSNSSIGASSNAAANLVMTGGTLLYTGGTASTDHSITSSGSYTINVSTAATNLTLKGTTLPNGLIKTGTGTLTLGAGAGAPNLTVNGGTLNNSSGNAINGLTIGAAGTFQVGSSNATLYFGSVADAGTFDLNGFTDQVGNLTGAGTVTNNAGSSTTGTLKFGGYSGSTSFSGNIVDGGSGGKTAVTVQTSSSDPAYAITLSGNNTYSGATTIGTSSGGNAATLHAGSTTALSANSAYVMGNFTGVTLDLAGYNNSIKSLSGGGTTGGNVTLGTGTLSIVGSNIAATYAGTISGSGGFTMGGTGTETLSGSNSYTGATTVNSGMLYIAGSTAAGSAVVINSGGNLGGTGTVGGAVTLGSSGAINLVDNKIGTLTIGGLTTTGGGSIDFDITTGSTNNLDLLADTGGFSISGNTTINITNLSGTGSLTLSTGTYNLITSGGTVNTGDFTLSTGTLDGDTLSLASSGGDLELVVGTSSGGPTTGTYTLTTSAGAAILHATGTMTLSTSLSNTGTSGQDSIAYNGVGASGAGGTVSGSATGSGTLTVGTGTTNSAQTYVAGASSGTFTISPTGSITGVSAGTPNGTTTGTTVVVYTGQGVWTGSAATGSWGPLAVNPTGWTQGGGTPGLDPNFKTTDSALFGNTGFTGTQTVSLNGDSPYLNNVTFNDAAGSYNIAQGSGGTLHMDAAATSTATIVDSAGSHQISAPVEFDAPVSDTVAASSTLTISGNISQTGTQSFAIGGLGATVLSGSNSYGGGTTVAAGATLWASNGTNGSATGTGSLTVNAGGTLGGAGRISATTFAIGAAGTQSTVIVGNGSDTSSQLALSGTSASSITNTKLEFNLSTAGGGNELAVGSTSLALSGDTLALNVANSGIIGLNTPYTLIVGTGGTGSGLGQYSGFTVGANGVISGIGLTITGVGAPAGWYNNSYLELVNVSGGADDIEVVFVPEPSTWAMMIGGLGFLFFWQRRRKYSSKV